MIPILMAGLGAARMVSPALAKLLVKKGIGKQVSKGTGRPIEKVSDLPATAQKMLKSPKEVAAHRASIKKVVAKPTSAVKRKSTGKTKVQKEKEEMDRIFEESRKISDKELEAATKSDKLMDIKDRNAMQAITGKRKAGGKVYRKKGGKVIKTNMSGNDLVRSCYD
tara:strand:- start:235 stop:732 length:498 start_codon:yes stop_codon:yes gene_type:complete